MKIKNVLLFLPLLLCGALFSNGLEPDYLYFDQECEHLSEDDGQISEVEGEPAIYSVYLPTSLNLKTHSILLNQHYRINTDITTLSGTKLFVHTTDGLEVKKSGLYRVSFYQRVHSYTPSGDKDCSFLVLLNRTPGNWYKRYQVESLAEGASTDIQFTQVLRLRAGEKLQVILRPFKGHTIIHPDANSSGFTIEAL